ncbi:glycine betaine ABC transporter substrate-binding protein [Caballeronia sp. DA-9]|uniref:glycine betaine ABC transporter substrate-binding protein n=1 Tax=Caballeronia sp. DA-9 TaxID=3436237 RepID=UPI003F67E2CF
MNRFGNVVLMGLSLLGCAHAEAACPAGGPIQIADMSWTSASMLAHVESTIIEKGYGCKTELIPGDTVPTITTMIKQGRPQIAPEFWGSNAQQILEDGKRSGAISVAGNTYTSGGIDAWWVPQYVVNDHPDIKSVQDLLRHSDLFQPPGSDKGRFYTSLPGWATETRSANLFKAYGLDAKFDIYSPGSTAALDAAIASAYERKKPIFFYYWGPSAVLGKYKMVRLQMKPYDPVNDSCNGQPNCQNPVPTSFPPAAVNTVVAASLKTASPEIYAFLAKVTIDNDVVNQMLAWGQDQKADPVQVADQFLKTQQPVWTRWVSKNVADQVISSLK